MPWTSIGELKLTNFRFPTLVHDKITIFIDNKSTTIDSYQCNVCHEVRNYIRFCGKVKYNGKRIEFNSGCVHIKQYDYACKCKSYENKDYNPCDMILCDIEHPVNMRISAYELKPQEWQFLKFYLNKKLAKQIIKYLLPDYVL